jgi:hypothetical protein
LATVGLPRGPDIEAFAVQNQAGFAVKNTLDNGDRNIKVSPIDMKNNPLTTVLLGVLTISALLSVGFCWRYVSNTRELRSLQTQANMINNNRTMINSLANDTVEYGKKNPAIDPILESVGLKPGKAAPTATTKPATK